MPTAGLIMQASRFPLVDAYVRRLREGVHGVPWQAAIELLLIGLVVYSVLRFLQGTRGARLMRAVLMLLSAFLLVAVLAQLLELDRIAVLFPYFVAGVFLVALVVFQPELRRGLMRIGETFGRGGLAAESVGIIEPVVQAAAGMSQRRIGALIALERVVPVGALIESGVRVDAQTSRELLETIFWPGSALHDLGVIIRGGRVAAAGCEFPLAETDADERVLGSRHRAALGMSLESDALVVVVSEETGSISVAERGKLYSGLTPEALRHRLRAGLLVDRPEQLTRLDAADRPLPPSAGGDGVQRATSSPAARTER